MQLICARVSDGEALEGSLEDRCGKCHEAVWLHPSSLQGLSGGRDSVSLLCLQCLAPGDDDPAKGN